MRKTCQFLALMLVATLLVSCGGDDEKPGQSFHALLDGEEFKEDGIIGYVEDGEVEVMASRDESDFVNIWVELEDIDGAGTYMIDESTSELGLDLELGDDVYYLIDGEITITKASGSRLEATFSGTAYNYETGDEIEVTEGVVKANVKEFQ